MILHCSKQSTTVLPCTATVVFHFFILPLTSPYAVSNLTLAKKQLLNDKITTSCPICLISTISNVTNCSNNNYELWKTTFVLEHKKFVHPCLLLYLLCYLYLLLMFWAVIFMIHSIWWQFLLLEFWQILGHSSFTM